MAAHPDLRNAIIALLENESGLSYGEIAEQLHRAPVTIRSCIKETNKRKRTFRVQRWERGLVSSGKPRPFWALGTGPDAPALVPLTRQEIAANYVAKNKLKIRLKNRVARGTKINIWSQLMFNIKPTK